MIRLGIIGCGNMGGAMLRQLLKKEVFKPEEILVSDVNAELLEKTQRELGVGTTQDNRLAAAAPVLLLAVKPAFIAQVAEGIRGAVGENTLVLSIVTGRTLAALAADLALPRGAIVRVMPNTPALVGEGMMAVCRGPYVNDGQWRQAMELLSCMGLCEEVAERQMDAVTGLSGSSPAFVFLFIEALADAGVRAGLSRPLSYKLAEQTVLGSAKLALESGLHPGQLKDMVTSPAGTTIEGIAALERNGFRFAVMDAVDAAVRKARQISQA